MFAKVSVWQVIKASVLIAIFMSLEGAADSKRPITVEDCIRTRRVFEGQVAVSSEIPAVAYVVEAPNVQTNKSEYRLYIRDFADPEQRGNGRLLLEAVTPIRGLRWVAHGTKLAILQGVAGKQVIRLIAAATGEGDLVAAPTEPITSYSSDASGNTFVYATATTRANTPREKDPKEWGYPIILGKGTGPRASSSESQNSESAVFVAKKEGSTGFAAARLFVDARRRPQEMPPLEGVSAISLSPDGRYMTFNYQMDEIPRAWQANPYSTWLQSAGAKYKQIALGLYDFQTEHFRVAFNCAGAGWGMPAAWASDSRAFSILTLAPVDSTWERRDKEMGFRFLNQYEEYTHLFSVEVDTGTISEVLEKPVDWVRNPTLWWKDSRGVMLVRKSKDTFSWLKREDSEWRETGESHSSLGAEVELRTGFSSITSSSMSDGIRVLGSFEQPIVPPDIFIHDLRQNRTTVLTDFNPEYRDIALGKVEKVQWQDRFGVHCTGFLIAPVGYESGKRYPLVIMVKGWGDAFLSDTGFHTAFPPQSLANAGFLVLMANAPGAGLVEQKKSLQEWPGTIGEAFEFIAFVEGAVDMLERRGSASRNNVGIIGFSRTSWQTDFMLTHSAFPFVAASSADSGLYNYGSYWMWNSDARMRDWESELGGPPYGATFENWVRFAPAFNAQNVRTPLLMEYTRAPGDLVGGLEFFVALKKQNKPVDLIYYPKGEHILDTPYERIASLQRNVDWFRFWMQGYEGTAPAYDPNQFTRWRELRDHSAFLPSQGED